jgi:hypothetical protein
MRHRFPSAPALLALTLVSGLAQRAPAQDARANEDESRVPAYTLPDPLARTDGRRVETATDWAAHRAEILRLFEDHEYGRSPAPPDNVRYVLLENDSTAFGGRATRKQVRLLLEGTETGASFDLLVYLPNGVPHPVPAFLGLNFEGNHAVNPDPAILLSKAWIRDGEGVVDHHATEAARGADAAAWPVERILDRGYAVATACYDDVEPDRPDGWKDGVRGRFGPGAKGALGSTDWGAIGAWAWGLSRALDYLETDADVDAGRVVVLGHSRLGKAALWAAAQDERFAAAVSNDSGEGGAALSRRRFGETVEAITRMFPHWFAPRFSDYAGHEDQLPVDQHMLLALVAPRPLYVASATEDLWADPRGEFLSLKAAEPVYRLLGQEGVGIDQPPAPDRPVGGTLAYHRRTGPHALTAYDWEQYLDFADRALRPAPAAPPE